MPEVGVLALQGGFAAHIAMLECLGATVREVRHVEDLEGLNGLVIPGGESTTLLKLMATEPAWWQALPAFHRAGGVIFGTCAGLILLAMGVDHPQQRSLGLLDVDVDRNAFGRQIASCEVMGTWAAGRPLEMIFIRAPRITRCGAAVEVLATRNGDPVLVQGSGILAASFHPELGRDEAVHRLFLEMVQAGEALRPGPLRLCQPA